ncbi:MAG: hypothetical protein F4169_04490 [Gammaproteobacteria bacterium]|nr:hypothetical protein [Gammaproteobacteria bacterium]
MTRTEKALNAGAIASSFAPWLGGPISGVLSGMSQSRKFDRAAEILRGLADRMAEFESDVSQNYVKTEDFEDLLEQTLRRGAEQRSVEIRKLYRNLLARAIKNPSDAYDDQIELLRVLEQMNVRHMVMLDALDQLPPPNAHLNMMGSPLQTLCERTGLSAVEIELALEKLNDLRVTKLNNLNMMMTGAAAQDLRHSITTLGRRLVEYVRDPD